MGYTPGFEGPHPSELPVYDPDADEPADRCAHNGLSDHWRGDDKTPPGYVWSCLERCGRVGSQTFYPDDPDGSNVLGWGRASQIQ